ncbi:MAG: chemotaxis protein CheD [Acidobacteriaceae bacterium]
MDPLDCGEPEVYLQPGEMLFALKPTIIRTLLGSCVGATFWNEQRRVGALCHAMLPRQPESISYTMGHRYVDFTIQHIARKFDSLGIPRSEVQVKLFGGADVLLVGKREAGRQTVGLVNCAAAKEILCAEGFRIFASSLRGTRGLKLSFDTGSGEVLVQRLKDATATEDSTAKNEGVSV